MVFNFTIPGNHPCLAGHFPNDPIVPGAIIMDEIISGIKNETHNMTTIHILNVKFLNILRADIPVRVEVQKNKNALSFNAMAQGAQQGVLTCGKLKIMNEL